MHTIKMTNWLTSTGIPYRSGTSEPVRMILGSQGVRILYRTHNKLKHQLIKIKDHPGMHDQDNRTDIITGSLCWININAG